MTGVAAPAGAGLSTYLFLLVLVACTAALLTTVLLRWRRSRRLPVLPDPPLPRGVLHPERPPARPSVTCVIVVPVDPRTPPVAHLRRAPRLVEDDVIDFGLRLEASDDVVGDVLAEREGGLT